MIVKKLYHKIKFMWWDKDRKVFKKMMVTEYLGWFLFGFIPIYLIELDRYDETNFEGCGECVLTYKINEKYKHLMIKDN